MLLPSGLAFRALFGVILGLGTSVLGAAEPVISAGSPGPSGFTVHEVQSEFQGGHTKVLIRLPDKRSAGGRLPTLYLLPVEAKDEQRWGDPLAEAAKLDLANRLNVINFAGLGYVLVVNASFPAKNVAELIAYAKANPGKVNYAAGSTQIGRAHV